MNKKTDEEITIKSPSNIIKFPKFTGDIDYTSSNKIIDYKQDFVEDVTSFLIGMVLHEMERANVFVEEADENNIILIMESIKSFMYKKYGMFHPLQEITINQVDGDIVDENEEFFDELLAEDEETEE